jgi:hypothetical protein
MVSPAQRGVLLNLADLVCAHDLTIFRRIENAHDWLEEQ